MNQFPIMLPWQQTSYQKKTGKLGIAWLLPWGGNNFLTAKSKQRSYFNEVCGNKINVWHDKTRFNCEI